MQEKILVAGIGNIFVGDDGFGVEVARRLARRKVPGGVRVVDFGIRGIDLAYALMDGYELAILVDATPRGGVPGTIYVIEPDLAQASMAGAGLIDGHEMNPMSVLGLVKSMGGECGRILVVGCEPEPLLEEEGRMGLSGAVSAAVDAAMETIEGLIAKELATGLARGDSEIRELGTVRGKS